MTDPFLEAVRNVPHDPRCDSLMRFMVGDCATQFGRCDCDRDARIAKGLASAIDATDVYYGPFAGDRSLEELTLPAFTDAAREG